MIEHDLTLSNLTGRVTNGNQSQTTATWREGKRERHPVWRRANVFPEKTTHFFFDTCCG